MTISQKLILGFSSHGYWNIVFVNNLVKRKDSQMPFFSAAKPEGQVLQNMLQLRIHPPSLT